MLRWFKKYFIPHKRNNHRPHLLRTEIIVFLLAVILFSEGIFLYSTFVLYPRSSLFSLILPNVLADDANASRAAIQEQQLTINALLVKAAQMKADDMAAKGYFAHTSPEGLDPWYWIKKAGYRYQAAGENLAVNFVDSQDVHNAWMNSPSHRENILNGTYSEIGIATATGMYKDKQAVFVVEMFGEPLKPAVKLNVAGAATVVPSRTPIMTARVTQTPMQPLTQVEGTLGIPIHAAAYASVKDRVIAQPRTTLSWFLKILLAAVGLAIVLSLVVWMEMRHPRLIINGMAVVIVVLTLLILNQHLATLSALIL